MDIEEVTKFKVANILFDSREAAATHVFGLAEREAVKTVNMGLAKATVAPYIPIRVDGKVDILESAVGYPLLLCDDLLRYIDGPISVLTAREFFDDWLNGEIECGFHASNHRKILKALLFFGSQVEVDWKEVLMRLSEFEIEPICL